VLILLFKCYKVRCQTCSLLSFKSKRSLGIAIFTSVLDVSISVSGYPLITELMLTIWLNSNA